MIIILTLFVGMSLLLLWLQQRELEAYKKIIKGQTRVIKALLSEKTDELKEAKTNLVREADENERW